MGKHERPAHNLNGVHFGADGLIIADICDDDLVLIDGLICYRAEPGTGIRDLSCIACGKPAGDTPFIISALVSGNPCPQGFPHLVGSIVIRHTTCDEGDAADISMIIIDKLGSHYT